MQRESFGGGQSNAMSELSFRPLTPGSLPPFSQYLLPETADALQTSAAELRALGAVLDRRACGAAAAQVVGDSAELLSFFVDETIRGQGVGGALLDALCSVCVLQGAAVLHASYVLAGAELSAMDALFLCRGAKKPQVRSHVYQVDTAHIRDVPILGPAFRASFREPAAVQPLSLLEPGALDALIADPAIPETLSLETTLNRAIPELCLFWSREGRISAYVLGGESADGGLTLLSAVSLPSAPGKAFLELLQALLNRAYYRGGGDFLFYTSALNPHTDALIHSLTRGRFTVYEEHTTVLPL